MWKGRGSVRGDEKERYNRTIGQWRVKLCQQIKLKREQDVHNTNQFHDNVRSKYNSVLKYVLVLSR